VVQADAVLWMLGVGVVHQHATEFGVPAHGFGQHAVLQADIAGPTDLHYFIGGMRQREVIEHDPIHTIQSQRVVEACAAGWQGFIPRGTTA